jgi:hypothetical protein
MKNWWLFLSLPIAGLVVLVGWLWAPAVISTGKIFFLVEIVFAIIYVIARLVFKNDKSLWERLSFALIFIICLIGAGLAIVAVGYAFYAIAFIGYAVAGVAAIKEILSMIH